MTPEQEDRLIEEKLMWMMDEDKQKLMSFLLLTATHNLVDSNKASATLVQHNDYKDKRYRVEVKMEIEQLSCDHCKHFQNYVNVYEDDLEDIESGICYCPTKQEHHTAAWDYCGKYESK